MTLSLIVATLTYKFINFLHTNVIARKKFAVTLTRLGEKKLRVALLTRIDPNFTFEQWSVRPRAVGGWSRKGWSLPNQIE